MLYNSFVVKNIHSGVIKFFFLISDFPKMYSDFLLNLPLGVFSTIRIDDWLDVLLKRQKSGGFFSIGQIRFE